MTDAYQSAPQGAQASSGGSIKDVAGSAAQAAKSTASDLASTAKSTASDLASTAKSKVSEQLGRGKDVIGTTMDELASAVRKAAEELNQHNQAAVGKVVMQGADSLQSLSRTVSQTQPGEILDTVRDFGRRNPMMLVGGSILVGLAIARFAKSSKQSDGSGSNLPTVTSQSTTSPYNTSPSTTSLSTSSPSATTHPTLPGSNLEVSPGQMGAAPLGSTEAYRAGDGIASDPLAAGAGVDPLATGGVLGSGV